MTIFRNLKARVVLFCLSSGGSVIVEFAMIGVAIVLLLLGIMQAGLYFYTAAALETVVAKATRQIMVGTIGSSSVTAAQFRSDVVCPLLPAGLFCANIITNISTVPAAPSPNGFYQYVNNNASWVIPPVMDNTQTKFCTGSGGSVVYAQIYYAMPITFPLFFKTISSTWQGKPVYFVGSFAAFRNEPFPNTSGGC